MTSLTWHAGSHTVSRVALLLLLLLVRRRGGRRGRRGLVMVMREMRAIVNSVGGCRRDKVIGRAVVSRHQIGAGRVGVVLIKRGQIHVWFDMVGGRGSSSSSSGRRRSSVAIRMICIHHGWKRRRGWRGWSDSGAITSNVIVVMRIVIPTAAIITVWCSPAMTCTCCSTSSSMIGVRTMAIQAWSLLNQIFAVDYFIIVVGRWCWWWIEWWHRCRSSEWMCIGVLTW